jgi:hypothetical protein
MAIPSCPFVISHNLPFADFVILISGGSADEARLEKSARRNNNDFRMLMH